MYILLALLAAFAYSIDFTLMARFYRNTDYMSAAAFRGLTLIVTMSPVLFFVDFSEFWILLDNFWWITLASVLAALGNIFSAKSYHYLKIGITAALRSALLTIVTLVISYFALGESHSSYVLFLVFLIIFLITKLSLARNHPSSTVVENKLLGFILCLLFSVSIGAALCINAYLIKEIDPLLVAYAWESYIGLFIGFFILIRKMLSLGQGIYPYTKKETLQIALYCIPTAIATSLTCLAFKLGNVAVTTAVGSTTVIFTMLFAYLFYKEKLTKERIVYILLVFLVIVLIKLAS